MKKSLIWLLIAAMLLPSSLASCNFTLPFETKSDITTLETTPDDSTPEETTPDETTPEETTLEVTTPDGGEIVVPPTLDNGITDGGVLVRATVTTGESQNEIFAGEELVSYLKKKNVAVTNDGFPIILFIDETLGDDCFLIDATLHGEEASMTIRGGNGRGVLYGVYQFLEQYAGVRYFTYELEKIPEGDIVLRDGNLLAYEPYFEYRHTSWHSAQKDPLWGVKNGLNGYGGLTPEIGGKIGYGSNLFVHTLGWLSETGDTLSPNPCLSSEQVYQTVIKNLRKVLEEDPTVNIVSVSQNDNNTYCTCEQCAAVDKEEGSPAGLMLRFVNRIAEELEADYPNLVIDTLAYNYTQPAPAITVPRHNVCVRVCSIRCCFMHPMTECNDAKGPNNIAWTKTSEFLRDLKDWGKICDRIYIWDYTTNYAYYVPPFSNFGVMRENMRFYYETGARGMFAQGNHHSISGEFGELRAYLLAKLIWNPYMSEEEYYTHMDEFLAAYYGEGWQGIRAFIDLTTELVSKPEGCINIYEAPLQSVTKAEYLEHEADIEAWWNTAEELAGDRLAFVQRSRLQWRYIKLMLHPDKEACDQFTADVNAWNIRWAENPNNNKPVNEMFPNLYPKTEE